MHGESYDINNPLTKLKVAASSCFFGEPMYYQPLEEGQKRSQKNNSSIIRRSVLSESDREMLAAELNAIDPKDWRSMTPASLLEKAIDDALDFNPEETLKFAAHLRNAENIRTTPQVILVRASMHPKVKGTDLVSKYGPQILRRTDETTVQAAYFGQKYSPTSSKIRKIPGSLKKLWARHLQSKNTYDLAKYQMSSRGVKLVDVVNLCHPKVTPAIDALVKGSLSNEGNTWEAVVSKEGSTKESWEKSIDVMGHMALLRNLRNLESKGVDPDKFLKKLVDGAPTGKQLPFRYYSAYRALGDSISPRFQDALEECMKASLGNLPKFGKTISLVDNSGSAHGALTSEYGTVKVSDIANLTGVLTAMQSDDGYVGVFGDRLKIMPIMKSGSILQQHANVCEVGKGIGGSTENGIWLFFDDAINKKTSYDSIFIYSDMQAGHGGLYGVNPNQYKDYRWNRTNNINVAKLVSKYRKEVNPNAFVFMIQVAGYQDSLIPEFYDRSYILGGWSGNVLHFANSMITLYGNKQ